MHVIIVSDYAEVTGGASQVAILGARALADHGAMVTFFCATHPISDRLRHDNIRVECLGIQDVWHRNPIAGAIGGLSNGAAAARFEALLSRADPCDTVIHFHQWTKALSPSVLRVAARTELAAVITLHDYLSFCPTGMYFDFGRNQPCTRKPLSLRCGAAACDARSYAHKAVRVARQFDLPALLRAVEDRWGFVHVSPAAARVARPHLPTGARHFTVTHPVDMKLAPPVAVSANRPFLYVGRFLREKGCLDLAEVGGAAGLELCFMGEGSARDALQARCPGARLLPWGTAADVAEALSRSRALVLPSICHETFGMVVPEALARGVPVIVSDRVGAGALVENGVNGMIHKAGDHEDLRQCLSAMQSDERVRMMGATAYRRYWAAPPTSAAYASAMSVVFADMLRPLRDLPRRH